MASWYRATNSGYHEAKSDFDWINRCGSEEQELLLEKVGDNTFNAYVIFE